MFSQRDSFKRLSKNGNQVKQKMYDAVTGDEVFFADLKSGYQLSKHEIVEIDRKVIKEEFKRDTAGVKVLKFVKEWDIPSMLANKHYWLVPDAKFKETKLMYALFASQLREEGLVGYATIMMRDVLHNCVIREYCGKLMLSVLEDFSLYRHDIELPDMPTELPENYKQIIKSQILGMKDEITPQDLEDKYLARVRQAVMDIVEQGITQALAVRTERNELEAEKERVAETLAVETERFISAGERKEGQ